MSYKVLDFELALSRYTCCVILCLTPWRHTSNQVNAVLHSTHSNPAICPAKVLTVYQTVYCNQLLHVRRWLIYLSLINVMDTGLLGANCSFCVHDLTATVALMMSLLSCICVLSSSCRKIQWHMYNMRSCSVYKVLCYQEHMLTGCNSNVIDMFKWRHSVAPDAESSLTPQYRVYCRHQWLGNYTFP